jgi:hypothetical protein
MRVPSFTLAFAAILAFADDVCADVPTVMVRICIPPNLVVEESWQQPPPGSDMFIFRNSLRDYIAANGGSGQLGYWIRDEAFTRFKEARAASSSVYADALLQVVSAQTKCPATNYTAQLEVDYQPPAETASVDDSTYQNYPSTDSAPDADSSSGELSDEAAGGILLGIGAALLCAAADCLGGSSSDSDEPSTTPPDYTPAEDPYNNAYQQYLDEQHAACVWAYSDISGC